MQRSMIRSQPDHKNKVIGRDINYDFLSATYICLYKQTEFMFHSPVLQFPVVQSDLDTDTGIDQTDPER